MHTTQPFNEGEWLRLLFLMNDTHAWLQDMERSLLYQLLIDDKSKLLRKTYYLSVTSLAHLPEKHYYKISRHPGCSKFTISVFDMVHWIREAFHTDAVPVTGSLNYRRCLDTGTVTGFTKEGADTTLITVITEPGGEVKTAFPGKL
jgi:hypothetical protein